MRSCASIVHVFLGSVCSTEAMGGGRILGSFDDLRSDHILVDNADGRLVTGHAE